jgi:hypothetical protein
MRTFELRVYKLRTKAETGAQPQHSSPFQFLSRSAMGWSYCDILVLRRPSTFIGELRFT